MLFSYYEAGNASYEFKWEKQISRQVGTRLDPNSANSGSRVDLGVEPCVGVGHKSQRW